LIVHPRPGYPFTLGLQIAYALDQAGLSVRTRAQNLGNEPLPFGAGQHPYFTVGTPLVDDVLLCIPGETRLELDPRRRLPTGEHVPVEDTDFDFRTPRQIGSLVLDECFCDLDRSNDGNVRVNLASIDGQRQLTVWLAEPYRYVQAFSGDTLLPEKRRRGLAIEPMTCPPNAFRTGVDVLVLEPEQAVELAWGVNFRIR
jgi:aldose 1-epimerase